MRLLLAALLLSACASYSQGPESTYDGPSLNGTGDGGPDGGDGGLDGGDGGPDGGGPDAGCAPLALNTTTIFEGCLNQNSGVGSVSVTGTTCAATISIFNIVCQGTASGGTRNAFDGGCNAFSPCTSSSLPGTIICSTGPSSSCSIIVDGGP